MLSQQRRRAQFIFIRDFYRIANHRQRANRWMIHRDLHLARDDLRIRKDAINRVDGTPGHTLRIQTRLPLDCRAREKYARQKRHEFRAMCAPRVIVHKSRVVKQFRQFERAAQALPKFFRERGDNEMPVFRFEGLIRHD